MSRTALIIGTGPGLSASFARICAREGLAVALAARRPEKIDGLADEIGASRHRCDASRREDVERLFTDLDRDGRDLEVVLYNPSARVRGSIVEIDPEAVRDALMTACYGGFLVGQAAARRMLARGGGSILFTGASASVKGYPQSASFAMGKFGLRGLAQSMARELAPRNVHVAHFVIDGGIAKGPSDPRGGESADSLLDPDAIASTYWAVHAQHRSAWTWEVELRPWVETF